MKADGFAWWKQRLEQMGRYFGAFRIDHILGFFRIWSIPVDEVEGIMGYFVRALPVPLNEFQARGIPFEHNRYTTPYITDHVLADVFGADHESVKRQFLHPDGFGNYALNPEFATQRQIERYFTALEHSENNQKLKVGLFDLVSNVILFEVKESAGQQFHFRFSMGRKSSFKAIDPNSKNKLKQLYVHYFFRRQEAMQKLPPLKRATNMLVCGEDLGMVPDCVPDVMKQLGLLSLEVQRMPKHSSREFSNPKDAPYLSVVTPSTHDMSTIRGWWTEDRAITQKFYNQELGQPGQAPAICEPWISKAITLQHLSSPAMWSIFQLQDLLGMDEHLRRQNPEDERINVPANPQNYWRYRMHLTLEALIQSHSFNSELKGCLQQTGR